MFLSQDDALIFAVANNPIDADDPQAVLRASRDAQVADGTLREDNELDLLGMPGRRSVIDKRGENGQPISLVVVQGIKGKQYYQLICVSAPGQDNSPRIQRFLKSFARASR